MKICVIGDCMVDETWFCDCNRLSPEAPIPVASLVEKVFVLGGAANVARNIRAIDPGIEIFLAGYIGREFSDLLEKERIELFEDGWVDKDLTNIKLRIIDKSKGYHLVRVDNEDSIGCKTRVLSSQEVIDWLQVIQPDSIILSDYLKGAITYHLARNIIDSQKARVFVDTRREDIDMFKDADWITPNRHEFERIMKHIDRSHLGWKQEPGMLCEYANLKGILLTRGSQGMDLYTTLPADTTGRINEIYLHDDPINCNVIDVTGAGDTALATFATILTTWPYLFDSYTYSTALRLSNTMAGEVCMHRGTTVPKRTLRELGYHYGNTKV